MATSESAIELQSKPDAPVQDVEKQVEEESASQPEAQENDAETTADGVVVKIDNATGTKKAQEAFNKGDADASMLLHDAKRHAPEQHGGSGSDYVKSIVFGGLDGIITTFAIVAAVVGAGLDPKVIILMGFSNVIADAISMGLGDFLSSKAENDFIMHERKREAWEFENYPEGEIEEMIEIYVNKGFEPEDAKTIITTYTSKPKYKDLFIDHMMIEELGQQVPDPDDNPAKDGLVTFLSFITFGSVPMWFYVVFVASGFDDKTGMFIIACCATALTMFALGAFKAKITHQSMFKSGALMMLNGSCAAAAAYLTGWGLEAVLDVSQGCS